MRGVEDPALAAVLADHWEWYVAWRPTVATTLGDHRYDAILPRQRELDIARYQAERDALHARFVALDEHLLGARDHETLALVRGALEAEAAADVCREHEWSISSASSPVAGLAYLSESHTVVTPEDGANLVARFRQGADWIGDIVDNLRRGVASGRVASREVLRRVIEQLDQQLAQPTESWSMLAPARAERPGWSEDEREAFSHALVAAVGGLRPELARLRDALCDDIMPHGREGTREGMHALPDGEAGYRARIREHIGVVRTAESLHALGRAEIARIDEELAALGARALGARDLADTLHRLRTDPALYFETGEQLVAAATAALDRARAATPRWIGRVPRTDCVVAITPDYEAPFSTIAYYRGPHYDGSKPGEYFINTYRPETRPRYELEALSWHEAIPGHHTQIALAQELDDLPMWRKLEGSTAYVEGWALYTERLADEMGLYSGDLDRLGMVSYDAWRASRLVIDTGLHALGWTRAEAEDYLRAHTALTEVNIRNEVDRYIAWPGQALAYKYGQLEIFALRREAEAALGGGFSLPGFHDVVLGAGAVTLPVLRARVEAWISACQRGL